VDRSWQRGAVETASLTITPDIQAALAFLQWLRPNGHWSIGAINPDDPKGLAWLTSANLDEIHTFLEQQGAQRRNLYYQPNTCARLGYRRASKSDVVLADVLHVDMDPPKVRSFEELEQWQRETNAQFGTEPYWSSRNLPIPSAIVFSGSGFQLLWKLVQPVVLWPEIAPGKREQDPALVADVEAQNYGLLQLIDPTHGGTQNVDRLLRIPGTANYPNAIKREKYGRSEPVLARSWTSDVCYDRERFPRMALPVAERKKREAGVLVIAGERITREQLARITVEKPGLFERIVNGPPAGLDRSAFNFAVVCDLARLDTEDEDIAAILGDEEYGVSESPREKPDPEREISRCIEAARAKVEEEAATDTDLAWTKVACTHITTYPLCGCVFPPDAIVEAAVTKAVITANVVAHQSAPAPNSIDLDSQLKAVQRTLGRRSDTASIRDGEYIKRVITGERLVDQTDEDEFEALRKAALAVARAALPGTTPAQLQARLSASAGRFAEHLPAIATEAHALSLQTVPLLPSTPRLVPQVSAPRIVDGAITLNEFVLEKKGSREGRPTNNSSHNIRLALYRMGIVLRHNRLISQETITKVDLSGAVIEPEELLQDIHELQLRDKMEHMFDVKPPMDELHGLCKVIGHERAYHPVLDYFDSLPRHDGVDRTGTWLIAAGAKDTPFVRAVSRIVLVAAVRRIREPGCKFDEMLILESPQGKFKSSAIQALVPDKTWFSDNFEFSNETKKMLEMIQGKWIVEVGELSGMSKRDHKELKNYLARQVDEARMASGRLNTIRPRQCVFIGTTNEGEGNGYLEDRSGNRRYWPVKIR